MNKTLQTAIKKTKRTCSLIGSNLKECPATKTGMYFDGDTSKYIPISHIFSWTESFFTGMAYWAYKITKDESLLKWMYQFCGEYHDKVFVTPTETMHDLGFLYSPYAVALYKLTGDENMKKIAVKAADELAKRFLPSCGCIAAWGRMDGQIPEYVDEELAKNHFFTESKGVAIVDCMMNLPLLFWASEVTKQPFYRRVAMAHADTTLKYFVRKDDSVCHAYRFDEETGAPVGVENFCGFGKDSHWARGTAWAIYGFAIAYDYTKKQEYLDVAVKLAKKFCNLCNPDGIPVWDFRLPDDRDKKLDTSAAAVTVCGINEILRHTQDEELKQYAEKAMHSLANVYMDNDVNVSGLLKNSDGHDTYTVFGDYYFIEALAMSEYGFERIW